METSPEKLGAHAGVVSFGAGATTKPGKRGLTKEYGSPGHSSSSSAELGAAAARAARDARWQARASRSQESRLQNLDFDPDD